MSVHGYSPQKYLVPDLHASARPLALTPCILGRIEERRYLLDSSADVHWWPLVGHVLLIDDIFRTECPSF